MNTIRRSRPLLGTFVEVKIWDEAADHAHQAITAAFDKIEEIQKILSIHNIESEVSKINSSVPGVSFKISKITYEILKICKSIFELSGGLFDVVFPISESISVSLNDIDLFEDYSVILKAPLRLDFGGIGKGYAVDKASEVLQQYGIKIGLVSAGGDMRAFGEKSHEIFLRMPQEPKKLVKASEIKNSSFATSANYFRNNNEGCINDNGIRNPLSGKKWDLDHSVSVSAATCAVSDALTKVLALQGTACAPILAAANAFGIYYDGIQLNYI